ncbi:MAG: hypothetical protein NZ934_00505 [Hadesarchaea archaeon]|nr:hypothetical protein [Hadesarchaea archaeon]
MIAELSVGVLAACAAGYALWRLRAKKATMRGRVLRYWEVKNLEEER